MPVWNPDLPDPIDYLAQWTDVPDNRSSTTGSRSSGSCSSSTRRQGRPFRWDLAEGAKGVQLAGLAMQSSAEGRRIDVPPLAV